MALPRGGGLPLRQLSAVHRVKGHVHWIEVL